MKRTLFVIAATLLAATSLSAQTRDSHGIISQQPEGQLFAYTRSGGATYATIYFLGDERQEGIATQIVFSEDGTKAYIMNILSHAATATWVEGNIEGDKIEVPLGQMVYWFDDGNYGMQLARVKVNGGIEQYTVQTSGSVTFKIQEQQLVLEETSGDPSNNIFDGLGLVYTGEAANEWSYYLDYATVFTRKDVSAVVPPENLETEQYSMEYENSGHIVNVGMQGGNVFVQGVSQTRLPESWMQGKIQGSTIVFPLTYAGFYSSYLLFYSGANGEYRKGDDGYYNWFYDWTDGTTTYAYDPADGSFSTTQTIFASNSDTSGGQGEAYHAPRFRRYQEYAATPADPNVSYFQDMGRFSILMLNVPLQDTEGRFMDPSKVSYQLYIDDDEPYTLYTDEYTRLPEDIDEVPYLFTDENREAFSRSYIYEKAYAIYLFQKGFDRIGVQTIYRGGGEEHRSRISYYAITPDRVAEISEAASSEVHYDLAGRRVSASHKGLTITRKADGTVVKSLKR